MARKLSFLHVFSERLPLLHFNKSCVVFDANVVANSSNSWGPLKRNPPQICDRLLSELCAANVGLDRMRGKLGLKASD